MELSDDDHIGRRPPPDPQGDEEVRRIVNAKGEDITVVLPGDEREGETVCQFLIQRDTDYNTVLDFGSDDVIVQKNPYTITPGRGFATFDVKTRKADDYCFTAVLQ
ncbi:MAG TPA: hypothetical protein VF576_06860, partial [Rubricoccaceae bacterium]